MPCQNAMESTPATLKISEKVRKYHFFPRKSIFVFLKNSTLLSIPSKISLWSLVAGRPDCIVHFSFANDYRPPTALNAQRFAPLLPAQHPIKNHARYKNCRNKVRGQTDHQRRG